ncbi:MAG TPA: cytochrome P460 family protein [Pyrinomonadaceae bacterium]|nr:cytochrome P460 family protein [Pyrinomonadaceae bacterium]
MYRLFALSLIIACGAILYLAAMVYAQDVNLVPYPEGFRKWTHVKSAIVGPGNRAFPKYGGMHHIYANQKALEGFTTGNFKDGSVIVFDLFELIEKDGARIEGSRRFIDVMHKDDKRFANTGGWGFEEFTGSSHTERVLDEKAAMTCFSCHVSQRDHGYVFSKLRE